MSRLNASIICLAGLWWASVACGPAAKESSQDTRSAQEEPAAATSAAGDRFSESEYGPFLRAYMTIKTALVKGEPETAREAAMRLARQLEDASVDGEIPAELLTAAQGIGEATELAAQRTHFSVLSEQLYGMLEAHGGYAGPLYWQHCPMAFDNQGANWLSTEEAIRNPYFGDQMLTCGRVEKVLATPPQ